MDKRFVCPIDGIASLPGIHRLLLDPEERD
jgi:hypothetical protein